MLKRIVCKSLFLILSRHGQLLLAAMILMLAPSCSSKEEAEKKNLTLWTSGDSKTLAAIKQTCIDFEKLHPSIKVNVEFIAGKSRTQKYLISMQAGKSGDVVMFHWAQVSVFAPKKCIMDLKPFIRRDNYDLGDYFPQGLMAYQYDGGQYCLPVNGSTLVLYYNKNLFDQARLDYPDDKWNFDDFLHAAQKLTLLKDKDGRQVVGCLPYDISSWLWSMGGEYADDGLSRISFNDPRTVEAVRVFWNLRHKWNISVKNLNLAGSDSTSLDVFERGNVGMSVSGPWSLPSYSGIKDFTWDIAPFPAGKKGRQTRYAGMGYGIWAKTKYPDEAWELLKFLQSREEQEKRATGFTDIPSRKSVAYGVWADQKAAFNVKTLLESISGGGDNVVRVFPKNELWPNISRYFNESMDLAMLDQISVDEGLNRAQRKADNFLARKRYVPGLVDYVGIALASCAMFFSVIFLSRKFQTRKNEPKT